MKNDALRKGEPEEDPYYDELPQIERDNLGVRKDAGKIYLQKMKKTDEDKKVERETAAKEETRNHWITKKERKGIEA